MVDGNRYVRGGDNRGKQERCCFSNETEGAQKPTFFRVGLSSLFSSAEKEALSLITVASTLGPVGIHNHVDT